MAKVGDGLGVLGAVGEQGHPGHSAGSRDSHARAAQHTVRGEGARHGGAVLQLHLGTARGGNLGMRELEFKMENTRYTEPTTTSIPSGWWVWYKI